MAFLIVVAEVVPIVVVVLDAVVLGTILVDGLLSFVNTFFHNPFIGAMVSIHLAHVLQYHTCYN